MAREDSLREDTRLLNADLAQTERDLAAQSEREAQSAAELEQELELLRGFGEFESLVDLPELDS